MGSRQSVMFQKKFKPPKVAVSDFYLKEQTKVSTDYIEVGDAQNSMTETSYRKHLSYSSGLPLTKSVSQQLAPVSSDYMEPWDNIPGKSIHNAVNVVNSQPIRKLQFADEDFLSECCWYKGEINRREAEKLLASQSLYAFLVRKKGESEYTISLKYQFGYIHMMIDQENGKYTLGSCKTKQFLTLLDVVNHYQKFPMDIEGVGKLQLTLPKFSNQQ